MSKVLVIDFGGQYNQLIVRRVREQNVYCEIFAYTASISRIKQFNPDAIIFTGGPHSVYADNSPKLDKEIFNLNIPILGICYGLQYIAHTLGGNVSSAQTKEYGKMKLKINPSKLFCNVEQNSTVWMSHSDSVNALPEGFGVIASTDSCKIAAYENTTRNIYGVQFHPEVNNSEYGTQIIANFLFEICKLKADWTMTNFVTDSINKIRQKVGNGKVMCALSGGVDSAVAVTLVNKAVGEQLVCVYVDTGLMRLRETEEIEKEFKVNQKINLITVDAKKQFFDALKGVTDPEAKRKIIGEQFIRIFESQAKKIGKVDFLVQGTIYPDVIESGSAIGGVIKSHHNVGGLPSVIDFKEIIEPLRDLFKDEVRKAGYELGLSSSVVERQPFPGPGLAIRIMGEVTRQKVELLQQADYLYRQEIASAGLQTKIWQYFAVLLDNRTVGVSGDCRTYGYTLALRAVNSIDGMTADWARIPYDILEKISCSIVNGISEITRIVYDITSKPPATIEWE